MRAGQAVANPTVSDITIDQNVYRDAVTLSPQEWMSKYHINDGYKAEIEHFSVAKDGTHAFAVSPDIDPALMQGWTRMFLLGNQLASEYKGQSGRPAADQFNLDVPSATVGKKVNDNTVITLVSRKDGELNINVAVTQKKIESAIRAGGTRNAGHRPDATLDPFQTAVDWGIEEGLHSAFYRQPNYSDKLLDETLKITPQDHANALADRSAYALYSVSPGERVIRDDFLNMHKTLGMEYSKDNWQSFLGEQGFTPGVARQAAPSQPKTVTTPPETIAEPVIQQAKAVVDPKMFSTTPITEQNANRLFSETPITEQNARPATAKGGNMEELGLGQGALFSLQVGATLLDPDARMSAADKTLTLAQLGTSATDASMGISNTIRPSVTPPGMFKTGFQGASSLIGLTASGKGLYNAVEARDARGIVMNGVSFTSSSLGTASTIAQFAGRAALASRLFLGANAIAAPLAVAGVYMQANDYADQMTDLAHTMNSLDNERIAASRAGISQNFRDVGLPLKPDLTEYKNLGVLSRTDNFVAIADHPDQIKAALLPRVQAGGNAYQERQDALESMASFTHSSTVGRLVNAVTPGDWDKDDATRMQQADTRIASGVQATGALSELSGAFPGNGPVIRGYADRLAVYQQRLQPLEKDYGDQIAQLNQIPDVYTTVRDRKNVAQMEGKGALDIAAGDHLNDPAVTAQRNYFENVVAAPLSKDQDKLAKANAALQGLQGQLHDATAWAGMKSPVAGRGNHFSPQQIQITNRHIADGKAQMGPLQDQVNREQDEVKALQQTVATDQGAVRNYVTAELVKKNVLAEREKVEAMTPEQQEAYFRKNAEFIAKAGLQDRQDLAWVGLSTSRQEYLAKAMEFAPGALAQEAQKDLTQNGAALAKIEQSNMALATANQSRASLGAVGDPPMLDASGKPLQDKEGRPVTYASLSTVMDSAIADEGRKLDAMRQDPGTQLSPDQQARITIEEAAVSQMKLDRATLESQKLAYQSMAYDKLERSQQATQQILGDRFGQLKSVEQTSPDVANTLNSVRNVMGNTEASAGNPAAPVTDPLATGRKTSVVVRS